IVAPCGAGEGAINSGVVRQLYLRKTSPPDLIGPTQPFFPKFDYTGREFALSYASASASFRPHFQQTAILAEEVALRNLVGLKTRPPLGRHFQKFYQRGDILLFLGIHDGPVFVLGWLQGATKFRSLGCITKTRIDGRRWYLATSERL